MSRQTDWQARKQTEGLCTLCGEKAAIKRNGKPASRCLNHLIQQREHIRGKLGSQKRYTVTDSYAFAATQKKPGQKPVKNRSKK